MHQMTDVFRHLIEIMRLQGEDDEVLGPGVPDVVDGVGNLGRVLAAVLPNQFQAVLADGVQVDTLVNDRDFFSCERQFGAHQSTDRAGAYNTDFHVVLPFMRPAPTGRVFNSRMYWPTCRSRR